MENTFNRIHCLFEQSGTFKNEFKKLRYKAFDYDILNDFGETDFQIDLFEEIERCYAGEFSLFDSFLTSDLVLAFFPCTRFEAQILMSFRGEAYQQKKVNRYLKERDTNKRMDELNRKKKVDKYKRNKKH